jgi:putative ABC transport system permease protein
MQVTLATVLLVSAGLLIRTVAHLAHTETGIEPRHALAMRLMLTETTRFDADARGPLVRAMLDRVRALPGVTSAGIGSNLPPGRSQIQLGVSLVDRNKPVVNLMASLASVTAGYLDAIGARTVAGRRFEDGDLTRGDHVAILSATAARVLFPDRDPMGVQLPFALPGTKIKSRVIGIVGDVRYEGLETSNVAAIYVPWSDLPVGMTYLVVRTDRDPLATAPAIVRTLRTLDPGLPVPSPHPLTAEIADLLAQRRMRAILGGGFAAAALLVALVGLAGMLARLVAERRREIAIRAALGATPRDATRLVVRDGVVLATMGVIVGLAGSFAAARGLSQLLYGVTAYDGITYLVVASGLLILAVFACYVPARRAAQVEPLELLRAE